LSERQKASIIELEKIKGHVLVLRVEDHILDGGDRDGGELAWAGARTGGAILETTDRVGAAPSVISRRREPKDGQNRGEWQGRLGAGDGAQERSLIGALRKPVASETEAGDAQEGEKKSDDGREALYPALELVDLGQEDLAVLLEGLDGDNRPRTTLVPGGDRGAGDLKVAVQRTDAGATHLLAEPVVVRAAPPGIGARDHRGPRARSMRGGEQRHRGRIPE
jgi:hypothetical protein